MIQNLEGLSRTRGGLNHENNCALNLFGALGRATQEEGAESQLTPSRAQSLAPAVASTICFTQPALSGV
jgi:hypothetical protein